MPRQANCATSMPRHGRAKPHPCRIKPHPCRVSASSLPCHTITITYRVTATVSFRPNRTRCRTL
ncbi:hypothetical protein BDR05DRAFT_955853 [Suillus weaverae]|nr:hypothetical protein BDR05DRAFT_955853 [Suillus weaverae]